MAFADSIAKDVNKPTAAQSLIERLSSMQAARTFAVGHHDDVAYGHTWKGVADSSDVKNVVGDMPAILDWDLGLIEKGGSKQLTYVSFDFIRESVKRHHKAGGFSTFSWHVSNPKTHGDAKDLSAGNVVKECVRNKGAVHDTMTVWINRAADFFLSLRDDDGNLIPVVFRPWHEMTGNWFWWGRANCKAKEYKNLWKMTRRIFDERGVSNVVWAYAPDYAGGNTPKAYMERYPGDEYVDIMGADTYCTNQTDGIAIYERNLRQLLDAAQQSAKKHRKVLALTETGFESIPMPNWFTQVLMPIISVYPIAYVTFWRNAYNAKGAYYVPYPGHPAAPDFLKFYELPQTLFLRDMND